MSQIDQLLQRMAALDVVSLVRSEHPNNYAMDPRVREVTKQWARTTAPFVVIYGPSGVGKTQLLGTLPQHPDYRPLLYLGIEQGDSTIASVVKNPALVDRRVFAGLAADRLQWTYSTIEEAKRVDAAVIALEGLSALHQSITGRKLKSAAKVEGRALQQLNIEASQRSASVISTVEELKIDRHALGNACPIFVTLNVKEVGLDDDKFNTPDWSSNLNERLMRLADAYIELDRSPSGVTMLTEKTPKNKHRKLRNPQVAALLQRYVDVSLPGLLALWAVTESMQINDIAQQTA